MSEEEIRSKSQCCSVIILRGIGFSGLNEKFNASNIRYVGRSFDELSKRSAFEERYTRGNSVLEYDIHQNIKKLRQKAELLYLYTRQKKETGILEPHNPY